MAYGHQYTQEQLEFLKSNIKGTPIKELTIMFNQHFNLNLSYEQIKGVCSRYKFTNGLNTTFKKGNKPWNTGLKGVVTGGVETQFKKGNRPQNYRPIGSERVTVDNYVEIKIADPNKWIHKHKFIWEQENGPVPKSYVVIFGDGNRRNFDINNLILVSRKQLLKLNQHNLIQNDAELTKSGVILTDIIMKISERKKAIKK